MTPSGEIAATKPDITSGHLVGAWFRIEKGPESGPPTYTYDECGVVWEGESGYPAPSHIAKDFAADRVTIGTVTLSDETGAERTMGPGESFFIHRGSNVKFSSTDYGICYKSGARAAARL